MATAEPLEIASPDTMTAITILTIFDRQNRHACQGKAW